jgi:hypothetical protein
VGPLFCVIDGPTRGRPWSSAASAASSAGLPRVQPCGVGSRRISCATRTRWSWPARACRSTSSSASSPRQPRHDVDLPPGNRPRGDHRRRPGAARPDDVGHRRVTTLSDRIRERERPRRSRFVRARAGVCASTSGAPARRPMVLVLRWSSWCSSLIELLAAPSGCGAPRAGTAPLQAPCSRRRWRGWRRACPRRR